MLTNNDLQNQVCGLCEGNSLQLFYPRIHSWNISRCNHCGLVQVIPLPSRTEVAGFYHEDMEHFIPYLGAIPTHRQYFNWKLDQIEREISHSLKNLRLLDVGCALGAMLEEAQKRGLRACGVDISADAVDFCQKRGLKVALGSLGSSKTAPLGQKFDIITAFEVIEHEHDPISMLRNMSGMLSRDGLVVISTPNFDNIWRKIMGRWWVGFRHPEHLWFFTGQTLELMLHQAGFSRIKIRHDERRLYSAGCLFSRSVDYFPFLKGVLKPLENIFKRVNIINPIDPWQDLLVFARK